MMHRRRICRGEAWEGRGHFGLRILLKWQTSFSCAAFGDVRRTFKRVAEMTPLDVYREQVREAILRRNGAPLLNSTVDHAAVIVQESFCNAQHSIKLLSYRLDPDCYARASVINDAKFFLADPNHKAEILVESSLWDSDNNYRWNNHPFIEPLKEFIFPNEDRGVKIRSVPKEWAESYQFNFLLLDDYGYRYETDRKRPAAVAAFLAPDTSKAPITNLDDIFGRLWEQSRELEIARAS